MGKKTRIRLQVRDYDKWLIKEIENTVEIKKQMGIDTNFSTELFRLVRKGILDDTDYQMEIAKRLNLFEDWQEKFKPEPEIDNDITN